MKSDHVSALIGVSSFHLVSIFCFIELAYYYGYLL